MAIDLKKATDKQMKAIFDEATMAGVEAAKGATLEMLTVQDSTTGRVYPSFPICGFAWVLVKPGNSRFANWLKKNDHGRTDSYYGGVNIWIGDYNQSYDMKVAHASAMAGVFNKYGINAYMGSRLD